MASWSSLGALAASGFSPLELLLLYSAFSSAVSAVAWSWRRSLPKTDESADGDLVAEDGESLDATDAAERQLSSPLEALHDHALHLDIGSPTHACRSPRVSPSPEISFYSGLAALPPGSARPLSPRSYLSSPRARSATPSEHSASEPTAAQQSRYAYLWADLPASISLACGACAFCLLPLPEAVAASLLSPALARGVALFWRRRGRSRAGTPRHRADFVGAVGLSLALAASLALLVMPSGRGIIGTRELAAGTAVAVERQTRARDRFGAVLALVGACSSAVARIRASVVGAHNQVTGSRLAHELRTHVGSALVALMLLPVAGKLGLTSTVRPWLMSDFEDVYAISAGLSMPSDRSCLRWDVAAAVFLASSLARLARSLSAASAHRLPISTSMSLSLLRVPTSWVIPVLVGTPGISWRGMVAGVAASSAIAFLALDAAPAQGAVVSGLDDPVPVSSAESYSARLQHQLSNGSSGASSFAPHTPGTKCRNRASPDIFAKTLNIAIPHTTLGSVVAPVTPTESP